MNCFRDIINRLCTLMAQEGADLWWQRSADELIGDELLNRLGLESGQLQKGQVFPFRFANTVQN
jgi:hypothetical protein